MKLKLMLSTATVSFVVLGGCAGTGGSKSPATATKIAKPLTAQDIVARYAKTIYGKDALKKHPSMTMKGTLSIEQYSLEGPFVRYVAAPDSNVSVFEIMGSSLSTGCHKGACWTQQPGSRPTVLSGGAAALAMQQADYAMWEHMDRYYTSMEIVPPADGTESPNYRIKAAKKSGEADYFDFSKESGLLTSAVIEGDTPQGHAKVALQYKNYKDFEGLMMPTEVTQGTAQATIKITFSEVSFGPVAEEKFAKPN